MATAPNVLAVIPARGGSKRFPRKNVYPLRGHPLIAYTIKACQGATKLTDWLVSTDERRSRKPRGVTMRQCHSSVLPISLATPTAIMA